MCKLTLAERVWDSVRNNISQLWMRWTAQSCQMRFTSCSYDSGICVSDILTDDRTDSMERLSVPKILLPFCDGSRQPSLFRGGGFH